jgi:hypothetical protein
MVLLTPACSFYVRGNHIPFNPRGAGDENLPWVQNVKAEEIFGKLS